MKESNFSLEPLPPFRLDLTARALQRRPINQTDSWNGETYSRVIALNGLPVLVEVRQSGGFRAPRLHVKSACEQRAPRNSVVNILNHLLGLNVNMKPFYRFAKTDSRLDALSGRFLGLKPPRFPSVFEGIVNGIACQQLSLHVGLTLLNRLSEKSGIPFHSSHGVRFSFPDSETLRHLPVRSFRALGFSTHKAIAVRSLSNEIHDGTFEPESLATRNDDQAIARLLELRGVGRWTAEYALLRGLGRTHLFPGDDIGARNNLKRWLRLSGTLDYAKVNKTLAKWRPFAGLLYFHLLLDSMESSNQAIDLDR